MMHRELSKVGPANRSYAKLQSLVVEYRAAWRSHDGSYSAGCVVKAIEAKVNACVESALYPER